MSPRLAYSTQNSTKAHLNRGTPNTHLYDALNVYLRQCQNLWRDVRHLQSICGMMLGMIQSEKVHPSGFGVYVTGRAKRAQSKQRRFRRNLTNRRINLAGVHQELMRQALSQWGLHRLYLSLDNPAVELFLCGLGGCGLPGTHRADCVPGGAAQK